MGNPEADGVYCETFCSLLSGYITIDLKIFSAPLMLCDCNVCLKLQDLKVADSCGGLCILRAFLI